jgi:hypothetical protein
MTEHHSRGIDMIRSLSVVAVLFAATVAVPFAAADDADLSGRWLLRYSIRGGEVNVCILKFDSKAGATTASVTAVAPRAPDVNVKDFHASGKTITFALSNGNSFAGAVGDDPKTILGSFGNDALVRASLTRTDKDSIATFVTRTALPPALAKAQQLLIKANTLRIQANREKDADKKKELQSSAREAQKEADQKSAALYREAAEKADSPYAIDAALALIHSASKSKVTADEAKTLAATIARTAAPFGPRYARSVGIEAGESLARNKELAGVAVDILGSILDRTSPAEPLAAQARLLSAQKTALETAGRSDAAKKIDARLAVVDGKLDADYLLKVPPFKAPRYAGRDHKSTNRVAVLELFTGAQCPPCVAADVAFDSLVHSYEPSDLILIQYHMHIPGPDPMTNPATLARWDYYSKLFPRDMRGTPTTLFNGKADAGGGGGMANAEDKSVEYRRIIDPILKESTPIKLSGAATRTGDKIRIDVQVDGAEATDDLTLRLLLVEDTVKYVGGNKLRFHHHVVRATPGGPEGVAVKEKTMTHSATLDIREIRTDLTKYLVDYAENERPFPSTARPLAMEALKAIALVQNDKTGEILQAKQMEIERK